MSSKKGALRAAPGKSFPRAKPRAPAGECDPSDLQPGSDSDLRHLLCSRPGAFPETEESELRCPFKILTLGLYPWGWGPEDSVHSITLGHVETGSRPVGTEYRF